MLRIEVTAGNREEALKEAHKKAETYFGEQIYSLVDEEANSTPKGPPAFECTFTFRTMYALADF